MSQPPNQSWDPNADNPGYSYPPQQPGYSTPPPQQQPGYSTPPPQQQPGYGAPPPPQQPPAYGAPPPGYGQQPGYPPQGGYGAPPSAPPPGYPSSEDKTYALVAHFGGAAGTFISGGVLGFVGPLVAYLVQGSKSAVAREHAKAALNFYIPISGAAVLLFIFGVCQGRFSGFILGLLVGGILWLLHIAVWLVGVIFGIIAGVKANEGTLYKYPFSFPFIK
jgi:uncharacterized protein